MSCDCYTIGGPFIAEDPDCPEHGWEAQKERERHEIKMEGLNQRIRFLEAERDALRKAIESAPIAMYHPTSGQPMYFAIAAKEQS